MHWQPPSEAWLSKWGGIKSVDDFPEPTTEVWEECWESLQFYSRNQSQWRFSAHGPIGLDYNALYADLTLMDVPKETAQQLMADIRIIEPVALNEITTPP